MDNAKRSVEEALTLAETKAAALRYLTDLAATSKEVPDPAALRGLGDILGEIEELVHRARTSLDGDALNIDLKKS